MLWLPVTTRSTRLLSVRAHYYFQRSSLIRALLSMRPSASATATLLPAAFTDADAIYVPSLVGTVTLQPLQVLDNDVFYAPLEATATCCCRSCVADADAIYAPSAQPGAVTLAPSLVTDGDALYGPTLSLFLLPSLVTMRIRPLRRALCSRRSFSRPRSMPATMRSILAGSRSVARAPGALHRCRHVPAPAFIPGAVSQLPAAVTDPEAFYARA